MLLSLSPQQLVSQWNQLVIQFAARVSAVVSGTAHCVCTRLSFSRPPWRRGRGEDAARPSARLLLARFGTFRSQMFRSCRGRRRQVTPVVLLTVAKNNWVQGASLNIGSASTCVQRGQLESQLAVSRAGHTMCPSLACLLIKRRTSACLYFVPEA